MMASSQKAVSSSMKANELLNQAAFSAQEVPSQSQRRVQGVGCRV
jgi:hypothetical protein